MFEVFFLVGIDNQWVNQQRLKLRPTISITKSVNNLPKCKEVNEIIIINDITNCYKD